MPMEACLGTFHDPYCNPPKLLIAIDPIQRHFQRSPRRNRAIGHHVKKSIPFGSVEFRHGRGCAWRSVDQVRLTGRHFDFAHACWFPSLFLFSSGVPNARLHPPPSNTAWLACSRIHWKWSRLDCNCKANSVPAANTPYITGTDRH